MFILTMLWVLFLLCVVIYSLLVMTTLLLIPLAFIPRLKPWAFCLGFCKTSFAAKIANHSSGKPSRRNKIKQSFTMS